MRRLLFARIPPLFLRRQITKTKEVSAEDNNDPIIGDCPVTVARRQSRQIREDSGH
jgi:hypothetical protein